MVADRDADLSPDWDTLVVTGPTVTLDTRGNTWFEWAATVRTTQSDSEPKRAS
jgi:hypothetical protein